MNTIKVYFDAPEGFENNPAPTFQKAHDNDAGYDLTAVEIEYVYYESIDGSLTNELSHIVYHTGIRLDMPDNFEAQIRPRSSIYKYDLTLCNSPGTIDAGYKGEIKVIFKPLSGNKRYYKLGDKIAQLVFHELPKVNLIAHAKDKHKQFVEIEYKFVKNSTSRGEGGFGSTDK